MRVVVKCATERVRPCRHCTSRRIVFTNGPARSDHGTGLCYLSWPSRGVRDLRADSRAATWSARRDPSHARPFLRGNVDSVSFYRTMHARSVSLRLGFDRPEGAWPGYCSLLTLYKVIFVNDASGPDDISMCIDLPICLALKTSESLQRKDCSLNIGVVSASGRSKNCEALTT
jgi:hypothetical protein